MKTSWALHITSYLYVAVSTWDLHTLGQKLNIYSFRYFLCFKANKSVLHSSSNDRSTPAKVGLRWLLRKMVTV